MELPLLEMRPQVSVIFFFPGQSLAKAAMKIGRVCDWLRVGDLYIKDQVTTHMNCASLHRDRTTAKIKHRETHARGRGLLRWQGLRECALGDE